MQFGLWKRPRVVAGRVYVVKGLGIVRVTAVERIDLSRLTPWEAGAAGAKDVTELRAWLKQEYPDSDPQTDSGYRVRFRYLGPETDGGATPEAQEGQASAGAEAAPSDQEKPSTPPVKPKPVPKDLMEWLEKRPWRLEHLRMLERGVWRNAEDLCSELEEDSATTRRRMGDLRKRGLVTSHRHHGYRITPEGHGALQGTVEDSPDVVGTTAAGWLKEKVGRTDLMDLLRDGRWHNAAGLGEALDISVVSVQRRVAALRDRGLVESHRRRGYRLTEVGFDAMGMVPHGEDASVEAVPTPYEAEAATPPRPDVAPSEVEDAPEPEPEVAVDSIPADLLEWLESRPYRKELLLAIPPGDYISSSELSELFILPVTTVHGRLATLKKRGLVEAVSRRGFTLTDMGQKASEVVRALAMLRRDEPPGASAFLSAEPEGWVRGPVPEARPERVVPVPAMTRRKRGTETACGFCQSDGRSPPSPGWTASLQHYLEDGSNGNGKVEPIPCRRGVMEDPHWFLVVERDPLAEGHCKLVCKEHVADLVELADQASRDPRMALVRDTLSRDLMLSVEVITLLDERIVDVMVISGLEVGTHLHFDLVPRYRMDLPGLRPLASTKAHYDDLSLSRKRRLWKDRSKHLEEVATGLRAAARTLLSGQGPAGMQVSD